MTETIARIVKMNIVAKVFILLKFNAERIFGDSCENNEEIRRCS